MVYEDEELTIFGAPRPTEESTTDDLRAFRDHMAKSLNEILDNIDDGKEYDNKFNVKLEFNGQKLNIAMCADLYDSLDIFIAGALRAI